MATRLKSYTLILVLVLFQTVIVVTPEGVESCIDTGGGTVYCP